MDINIIILITILILMGKSEADGPEIDEIREHKSLRSTNSQKSVDFFFPTDPPETNYNPYPQKVTFSPGIGSCNDPVLCENVPDYPEDVIKNALRQNNNLRYLATVDDISMLDQRIDSADDEALCSSEEKIVYPRSTQDKTDQWRFVINQDGFQQGIRTERCLNEDSKCNLIDGFAAGYETSCKQKYYYRTVASLLPNGTIGTFVGKFPSSCCCQVKFTGDPLSRIGINADDDPFNFGKSRFSPSKTKSSSSSRITTSQRTSEE